MQDFRVEVETTAQCVVVRIIGELDIATAPRVVEALDGLSDVPRVTVDLLDTSFIDSTGLLALVRAHQRFQGGQRDFSLVCSPDHTEIRRVIDIMGFDEVLTVFPTLADAGCEPLGGAQP